MTTKKRLNGSLDRMREDLAELDEAIEIARSLTKPSKGKCDEDAPKLSNQEHGNPW